MPFQRVIQALSFAFFIVLMLLAAFPLISPIPVDLFLRLDPVIFLGTWLSARAAVTSLLLAAIILALTAALGRFFCSTICPMGTTIDLTDRLILSKGKGKRRPRALPRSLKTIKYQILLFILGAALVGVSFVFLASPISLITRFYGLIIYPFASFLGDVGLSMIRPVARYLDIPALAYAVVATPRFALQWFTVFLFIGIFACAIISPRFWCRYLCPAGAFFALLSLKPLMRRKVSQRCNSCGLCQQNCPMDAIPEDPFMTDYSECIVCETCVRICPAKAVVFTGPNLKTDRPVNIFSQERRALICSGLSGVAAAIITLTGLNHFTGGNSPGKITDPSVIRPPGALPEDEFLARCIRCGECMKACPTNTLQPVGMRAGFAALLSPVITPRRGPCEPLCNVCGQVCPTGALRPLEPEEKIWAKVGTAYVLRHKCLAWEFGHECLICDEVCPFDAVKLKKVSGVHVAVPFVNENKCNGCGFCEYYCPVQAQSAIVVEPMNALRLTKGSYRKKGQELGLSFQTGPKDRHVPAVKGPQPPLESKNAASKGDLPPGFTE